MLQSLIERTKRQHVSSASGFYPLLGNTKGIFVLFVWPTSPELERYPNWHLQYAKIVAGPACNFNPLDVALGSSFAMHDKCLDRCSVFHGIYVFPVSLCFPLYAACCSFLSSQVPDLYCSPCFLCATYLATTRTVECPCTLMLKINKTGEIVFPARTTRRPLVYGGGTF